MNSSTERLAQRARDGSASGFSDLYERIAPSVFAWAMIKIRPHRLKDMDPEDVVQEVWLRAMNAFDRYDPDRGSFRAWIFTIATNVLLASFQRLQSRRARGDAVSLRSEHLEAIPDQASQISRRAARNEDVRILIEVINTLAPEDRQIFVLFGLEGLRSPQVGELMGLTPAACLKRWQRLREELRGRLAFDPDVVVPTPGE